MNRRKFLKRFAALCGLPVAASVLPLPKMVAAPTVNVSERMTASEILRRQDQVVIDLLDQMSNTAFDRQVKEAYREAGKLRAGVVCSAPS